MLRQKAEVASCLSRSPGHCVLASFRRRVRGQQLLSTELAVRLRTSPQRVRAGFNSDTGGKLMPRISQYSSTINSTIEAKLRRSRSAAATKAAFTSGGTRTLTTSVFVTVTRCSCVKNASVSLSLAGKRAARSCPAHDSDQQMRWWSNATRKRASSE